MTTPTRQAAALVALGTVLLAASYPPFRLPVVSFLAVAPAVVLLRRFESERDPGGAVRWGFWYGCVVQGAVLYWLVVALWHFTPLSALGYLATIVLFGLWHALLFWLVVHVRLRLPAVPLWVVFPVAWTAVEWAVGHQGDIRFPWLGLGTSLADAPVLAQWADLAGARGVTLWLAWCNVMLVDALLGSREQGAGSGALRWRPAAAMLASIVCAGAYGGWRERTLPIHELGTVGLIQPNEGFREKWDPRHADSVVAKLVSMSRALEARGPIDLLLWPEAAIPGWLAEMPGWDAQFAALARAGRTPILAGGIHAVRSDVYYNAAFFYDSTGQWRPHPVYGKHYLVPVVERVPFVPVRLFQSVPGLRQWSGGFSPGPTLPLYETRIGRFGVIICYESAFEELARAYRRAGADFLVNITNDAWYGPTSAPRQHLAQATLRAVENRVPLVRVANTGISAVIDSDGRIRWQGPLEEAIQHVDEISWPGVRTFYTRFGDVFAWGCPLVTVVALAVGSARRSG